MAIDLLLRSEKASDSPITVEEHDANFLAIETLVNTNESDISSLGGRLDTAENDIDNLESDMGTAQGDIGNLETAVGLNTSHRGVVSGNPHSVTRTDLNLSNIINGDTGVVVTGDSGITGDLDITGDLGVAGDIDVTGDNYLTLPNGAAINEFSTDSTLGGDSDAAVPTEKAVKAYVDNAAAPKGKNAVINGNFDVWQRGTSFNAPAEYTADRWTNYFNGSGSDMTITKQDFTVGQTDVPNNPDSYLQAAVTSGSTTGEYIFISHRIEDVRSFSGETVTFSFWARATSGTPFVALEYVQAFGSGGSSEISGIGATKFQISTAWTRYTATVDIPSISGKTIGAGSFLAATLWMSGGSDFNSRTDSIGNQSATFKFAQVQLEKGSVATEFEVRPIEQELALCQRYYEKSYNSSSYGGDATFPGAAVVQAVQAINNGVLCAHETGFKVRKRTAPSVTLYSTGSGTSGYIYNGPLAADKTARAVYIGQTAFVVQATETIATALGQVMYYQWDADAEL